MTFKDDFATDLPIFLNPDEYGKVATYKGSPINVQFFRSYEGASPFETNIESGRVWVLARTSDVADAVHGDTLTIDVVVYKIIGNEPGDSGFNILRLAK